MSTSEQTDRKAALIEAPELRDLLGAGSDVTLLDVRWELTGSRPDQFEAGHIAGAVFVDLERELSDANIAPEVAGRHPLPAADAFTASAQTWGVCAEHLVVVMDGRTSVAAARAWWLLRWFGHRRVRVLDGGFDAWQRAGLPVVVGPEQVVTQGDFVAEPGGMRTVDLAAVAVEDRSFALLDSRAAERYRGVVEPVDPVPGHIPGAISVPTLDAIDIDGLFRQSRDLAADFDAAGVPRDRAVVTSCGSGVTAAHQILALSLVGIDAALFNGSYSLWCRTEGLPIVTGEGAG